MQTSCPLGRLFDWLYWHRSDSWASLPKFLWFQPDNMVRLKEAIRAGADLNAHIYWDELFRGNIGTFRNRAETSVPSIIYEWIHRFEFEYSMRSFKYIKKYCEFFVFLFSNGLSYFYGQRKHTFFCKRFWGEYKTNVKVGIVLRCGLWRQLLALGYGRPELHASGIELFDENLEATRRTLHDLQDKKIAKELRTLLDNVDAGPLTLQQPSRIAVRRAIGGVHFEQRICTLTTNLPPRFVEYLANPTEMMYRDKLIQELEIIAPYCFIIILLNYDFYTILILCLSLK